MSGPGPDRPTGLERSQRADFFVSISVGADEQPQRLAEAIATVIARTMSYRDPMVVYSRPDESLAVARPDADQMMADVLQPLSPAEQDAFRLMKHRARVDDGRLLLVRVHHQGRNRALVVMATPTGAGEVDLHALALIADAEMLKDITPAR